MVTKINSGTTRYFKVNGIIITTLFIVYHLLIIVFLTNLNYRVRDFSCMYNKPDVGYDSKYPPAGNGYSEPTDNSDSNDDEYSNDDKYSNDNEYSIHETFTSTNDDNILVFDLSEFAPDKKIAVFYQLNILVITQWNMEKVPRSWSRNQEKSDLRKREPDTKRIILNPATINPSKPIHFTHDKGYIYIYQMADTSSYENVESTRHKLDPTNKPDLHISTKITNKIFVKRSDFNLNKMVNVFVKNQRLYVSQSNAPKNDNLKLTAFPKIQYCQNANQPITLNPLLLNPDKEFEIVCSFNIICIVEQSDTYSRFSKDDFENLMHEANNETFVTETATRVPVPDILGTTPKSDLKSPVTDFNIAVESEVLIAIFPYEFNLDKLVLISFENGRLKVTQIGAPEETNPNLLDGLDILHTVTSDKNKLLLHPARIPSQDEIKMIHRNNDIYIWTKSNQEPDINVDNPDLLQVIRPEMDFNNTPDIVSMTDEIGKGNEFNPEENRPERPVPDNGSPESHDEVILKPDHQKPESDHKPSEINNSTIEDFSKFFEDSLPIVLTSNKFNPNKLVVISHKNHKINVYQVERNGNNADLNAGYVDLHHSFSDKTTLTFDPLMIDPKKIIIINYIDNKIHVNSAPL